MPLQADSQAAIDALGQAGLLGDLLLFDRIRNSNRLVGADCTPIDGTNTACTNTAVCCEDNYQNGALAVGCSNLMFPLDL